MKFVHLSDLHIGKRFGEASLIEDQEYILNNIIKIIDEEKPNAVIIAGDVYDKAVPSAEAVQLFDVFLCNLSERKLQVFVISGNHDSPERIAFGSRLMNKSGIYMSPVYDGTITPVEIEDEYGKVLIHMLPFVKPAHVRNVFPDAEIQGYTEALRCVINNMNIDSNCRNILITHQFVTGAETSGSEELSVGGSDNVDVSVFDAFDYVALGHIHRAQRVGRETVRYSGTPLKYSFAECNHKKSVTVVEMGSKGEVVIRLVELVPKRDVREIKGLYSEITRRDFYAETSCDDYLHVILTDEEDIPEALGKLRVIYPNIRSLDYDNKRTRGSGIIEDACEVANKSPLDIFAEFYEKRNSQPMSEVQTKFVKSLIERIEEEMK
ncbi:MAG: exonuclease SbcCD subunit D [Clostridia bacterium]|nr:exonuclease SbcCD subunit D [Clostridia bacterium]